MSIGPSARRCARDLAACGPSAERNRIGCEHRRRPRPATLPRRLAAASIATLSANRYSPLTEITAANVATLHVELDVPARRQLDGRADRRRRRHVHAEPRPRRRARRRHRRTEVWAYVLPAPPPAAGRRCRRRRRCRGPAVAAPTASTRGVSYWPGDGTLAPRILFMSRANLIALDAATGTPAAGFGSDGDGRRRRPVRRHAHGLRNVAIIGAASGEVPQGPAGNPRAFDVRTGAKLWEFQTVPRAGEPFNETWGNGWEGPRRHEHVGRSRRPSMPSVASRICRSQVPPRITTAAIDPATTCSPTRSSPSTRARASTVALPDRAPRSLGHRHAVAPAACSSSCATARACRRSRMSASRLFLRAGSRRQASR